MQLLINRITSYNWLEFQMLNVGEFQQYGNLFLYLRLSIFVVCKIRSHIPHVCITALNKLKQTVPVTDLRLEVRKEDTNCLFKHSTVVVYHKLFLMIFAGLQCFMHVTFWRQRFSGEVETFLQDFEKDKEYNYSCGGIKVHRSATKINFDLYEIV